MGLETKGHLVIPTTGKCKVCSRVVTSASYCIACKKFICWRCESHHLECAIRKHVPYSKRASGAPHISYWICRTPGCSRYCAVMPSKTHSAFPVCKVCRRVMESAVAKTEHFP
jgi:hypothetical protein